MGRAVDGPPGGGRGGHPRTPTATAAAAAAAVATAKLPPPPPPHRPPPVRYFQSAQKELEDAKMAAAAAAEKEAKAKPAEAPSTPSRVARSAAVTVPSLTINGGACQHPHATSRTPPPSPPLSLSLSHTSSNEGREGPGVEWGGVTGVLEGAGAHGALIVGGGAVSGDTRRGPPSIGGNQ